MDSDDFFPFRCLQCFSINVTVDEGNFSMIFKIAMIADRGDKVLLPFHVFFKILLLCQSLIIGI
jgi:hypothetical protein